jgi:hypothetical protein
VALEAAEFWLSFCESELGMELLIPVLSRLIPVLMKNMVSTRGGGQRSQEFSHNYRQQRRLICHRWLLHYVTSHVPLVTFVSCNTCPTSAGFDDEYDEEVQAAEDAELSYALLNCQHDKFKKLLWHCRCLTSMTRRCRQQRRLSCRRVSQTVRRTSGQHTPSTARAGQITAWRVQQTARVSGR